MCLTEEWFTARAQAMDFPRYKGHIDLHDFMRVMGWDAERLMAAGVLRLKPMRSTAELLEHEPTPAFRKHFLVRKEYDILMLKPGRGMALVQAVGVAEQRAARM